MTNLTARTLFDELFRDYGPGFFIKPAPRAVSAANGVLPVFGIPTEVREGAGEYTIVAELPGVAKEDIHVSIEANVVSLSAEVKRATEVAAPSAEKPADAHGAVANAAQPTPSTRVLRSELRYGRAQRRFSLPAEVDASNARAKYENGVLTLTLPKQTVAAVRELTVE